MQHKTVLLHQSIEGLAIQKGDVFLDCTINGGGHSEEVAKLHGKEVKIVGLDMDADALLRAKARLEKQNADFILKQSNFRDLDKALAEAGLEKADRILFDLGLSSNQFEDSGRGFSFQKDEPLLMTFKKNPEEEKGDLTVREIVNTWQEESIADIIYGYGEEQFSRRIAKGIVMAREEKPIETTSELVAIIKASTPAFYQKKKTHYATKTFQALRITVNDEILALRDGLEKAYGVLPAGGRMALISFHSIEDRIVKNFFKGKKETYGSMIVTKKPIAPSLDEVKENPRSRSAKLRILQK